MSPAPFARPGTTTAPVEDWSTLTDRHRAQYLAELIRNGANPLFALARSLTHEPLTMSAECA